MVFDSEMWHPNSEFCCGTRSLLRDAFAVGGRCSIAPLAEEISQMQRTQAGLIFLSSTGGGTMLASCTIILRPC